MPKVQVSLVYFYQKITWEVKFTRGRLNSSRNCAFLLRQ